MSLESKGAVNGLVTFSGYGESCLRLDVHVELAKRIKGAGGSVRVLTDGQGNLIHGRNIVPDLSGLVDQIRITLHAESSEKYVKVAAPRSGEEAFQSVLAFIRDANRIIPDVEVVIPNRPMMIDVDRLEKPVADDLGVRTVRHNFAVYS